MNDEIKEILDDLKFTSNDVMWCDKITLDVEQSHLLLDYITNLQQKEELLRQEISDVRKAFNNLQQENKEWGMIFDTFSKRPYAHRYLEEKRKELGNKRIIGLDSEMIYKEYYDLKEIEQEHQRINGKLRKENSKLEIALQNIQQINNNQAKRNSRQRLANQKQQELILKLQQENERLKKALNCKEYFSSTMPEDTEFVILTKNNYDRQQKDIQFELIDYKSRCKKAIEYLEQPYRDNFDYSKAELLNILQNGSDDNE